MKQIEDVKQAEEMGVVFIGSIWNHSGSTGCLCNLREVLKDNPRPEIPFMIESSPLRECSFDGGKEKRAWNE